MAAGGFAGTGWRRRLAVAGALGATAVGAISIAACGSGSRVGGSPSASGSQAAASSRPRNVGAPSVLGLAQSGLRLVASAGSWSGKPDSLTFSWRRCDAVGGRCRAIAGVTAPIYTVAAQDVGSTLRVSVSAANARGRSRPAQSARTSVVAPARRVVHLEYVFNDGPVSVYSIDQGFRLLETFALPGTQRGVRGVTVSPATGTMFVSYGGDGGGDGNGSVLAYDLLSRRVRWSVNLNSGVDSGAVSPDGRLLYMPDGESSSNGDWYILDTADGKVVGKIETAGSGPHDGVMSADGLVLQMGDTGYSRLSIFNTQTGMVQEQVGPLVGGVRPNTINGSDSIGFTTANSFDGFQVLSIIQPGRVLYTESFGRCDESSTCSHGISLSPDNGQLYVIDHVHKQVQVWDVHGVARGIPPAHLASIPVDGLEGGEKQCAYDCGRSGWLQHSLDGRYVFVGDSGDVIETATRRVVAKIENMLNTRKFVEIDWSDGVPVASSGREGVGQVP